MRTDRLLTASRRIPCISGGGGGSASRRVCYQAGLHPEGPHPGGVCIHGVGVGQIPPVCLQGGLGRHPRGQKNTCENIILPQTSFAGGNECLDLHLKLFKPQHPRNFVHSGILERWQVGPPYVKSAAAMPSSVNK